MVSCVVPVVAVPVLKDVEVVAGRDGDDVVRRVPGGVEDFLSEVQTVHTDVAVPLLPSHTHAARPEHGPALTHLPTRLQSHVPPAGPVKHPEEVVIRACHDDTRRKKSGGDYSLE